MDKVKHALGLDKSGSGGAQGMGDNRLDGHNTYDAQAGGTGVHTATGTGMTNAATTGTAPGYQEHHAQHEKHHGHHTASGAVAGGVVGGPAGAVVGGVAGHEMGERGQHGHHNQHGATHDGQQKEGMMHKIEAKMGMAPEQREAKKEQKAMHENPSATGMHNTHANSGMMTDNLAGGSGATGLNTGTQPHHSHHTGSGAVAGGLVGGPAGAAVGGVAGHEMGEHHGHHHGTTTGQTVPVSNIREQAGGFVGKPDGHGNVY